MSDSDKGGVEARVAACYATWADRYHADYYGADAAYPPVHADLIKSLLVEAKAERLLDAGCGPASFLKHMADLELDWHGFDLTPEMVAEARRVADDLGRADARVWVGSVLDDAAFAPPGDPIAFDAAAMIGVLPHIPEAEDGAVLARLAKAVEPGGLLIAEARNALFGLFTLNRPSFALLRDRLIGWDGLAARAEGAEADALKGLEIALANGFRMDLPPIRGGYKDEPGYDEVLSRDHVPFELADTARAAGWRDVEILYVHYHALPPMFEKAVPRLFREASLAMENPRDWRGMAMASSFLIVGRAGG